ncbi:uncharacterized [Tachysurus ichikawai]
MFGGPPGPLPPPLPPPRVGVEWSSAYGHRAPGERVKELIKELRGRKGRVTQRQASLLSRCGRHGDGRDAFPPRAQAPPPSAPLQP